MFPRTALVILGLLVAAIAAVVVASVRIGGQADSAKHMRVLSDIQAFDTQLKLYYTENGSFPKAEQGLQALVEKQLLGPIPEDPWNTKYIYRCPGEKHPDGYDLFSAGPDRKPDTADDDWGK